MRARQQNFESPESALAGGTWAGLGPPEATSRFDPIDLLPVDRSVWSVSDDMARLLARLIASFQPKSVLEFGAGWSSVVLAHALAAIGGGRLTSVEHQPDYLGECWQRVEAVRQVDARLVVCPLRSGLSRHGLLWRYAGLTRHIRARAPFDFVVIDAPPGAFGRSAALFDSYSLLSAGALIILDDAARPRERTAVSRWLRSLPGLELVMFDDRVERGLAVLRHDGDKRRRFAPRPFLGTFRDRLRRLRSRRRRSKV